jgi:hypothetical protein
MKIKTVLDVSNVVSWEELRRYVSQMVKSIVEIINGNVDLVDNCATSIVTVNFSAASTTVQVAHTLKRLPQGYIVTQSSAGISVFDGNKSNTDSHVYVQASGAGTVTLLVF